MPRNFWIIALTGVLPSRDSEIRGAIVRITNTNRILKSLINKLFPMKNTYQDTNQTGTARKQKLKRKAAVITNLKRKYECLLREHLGKESLTSQI